MQDARNGTTYLEHGGKRTPLRFTWSRIDDLGQAGVTTMLVKVDSGEAGGLAALAELIEKASGGELQAADLMNDPPPFNTALVAVMEAWALSLHGPSMKPLKVADDRPRNRLRTWWSTLCRRLLGRD